MIQEC